MKYGVGQLAYAGGLFAADELAGDGSEDFGFMIKLFRKFKIGNVVLYITSTHICLIVVTLVLLTAAVIINHIIKKQTFGGHPEHYRILRR